MTSLGTHHSRSARPVFQALLIGGACVLLWQILVSRGIWDATIVPSPQQIGNAIWEFRNRLFTDAGITLGEIVLGFLLTTSLAVNVAVLIHVWPQQTAGVYTLLVILQAVPLWSVAPVLFYWVGPGLLARSIVIVLVAFFPVLVSTVEGLKRIDSDLLDLFESMNATAFQRLRLLEFPTALHMVLVGSKITLTLCLIGAVLSEMLIGDMLGLGYRIKEANAHFRIDLVFGSIVILSVIMICLYGLLNLISRWLQPWTSNREDSYENW